MDLYFQSRPMVTIRPLLVNPSGALTQKDLFDYDCGRFRSRTRSCGLIAPPAEEGP
jgi:hypothetical protein